MQERVREAMRPNVFVGNESGGDIGEYRICVRVDPLRMLISRRRECAPQVLTNVIAVIIRHLKPIHA